MKEIRQTTEDVRARLLDFFRHPRKEFRARAKHLKIVMDHIRSLPSDSLALRRLATCPDLYDFHDNKFSFPAAGFESEKDLVVDYCHQCFWMLDRGKYFSTENECNAWFEKFVDCLIEDGQNATAICGGYSEIGACDNDEDDDDSDDNDVVTEDDEEDEYGDWDGDWLRSELLDAAQQLKGVEAPISEADDEAAYVKWYRESLRSIVAPEVWQFGQLMCESLELLRKVFATERTTE